MTRPPRIPGRCPVSALALVAALVCLAAAPPVAHAQNGAINDAENDAAPPQTDADSAPDGTLIAGGADHLWVVRSGEEGRFTVLHRGPEAPEKALFRALKATGRPIAAAAHGAQLVLVYPDRSVQQLRHSPAEQSGRPAVYEPTQLPPLPEGAAVLDLVVRETGPAVLVRTPAESGDAAKAENADRAAANGTDANPDATPAGEETGPKRTVKLLLLERGRWDAVPLPKDLPAAEARSLTAVDPESGELAVLSAAANGPNLRVDRYGGDRWSTQRYELSWSAGAQAIGLQKDIYLLQPAGANEPAGRLNVHWLRRGQAKRVGAIELRESLSPWKALPAGQRIALAGLAGDNRIGLLYWDVTDPPEAAPPISLLQEQQRPIEMPNPMTLIVVGAIIIAMLLLFASARRNPEASIPRLPETMKPAGPPRAAAAAIDLVPGVGVAMAAFTIANPVEIFLRWPGTAGEWTETLPGLVVIGVHVVHTGVSEATTGRSLGKMLLGCRVVGLTGLSPSTGQILVRNGFKIVEMIAPLLLIMPFLGNHQQRLGDLVARTVVITAAPTGDEHENP